MNILCLGNSFSDNMVEYAKEIAENLGEKLNWVNLVYPGCTIDQHIDFYKNNSRVYFLRDYLGKERFEKKEATMKEAFTLTNFDLVTVQQSSFQSPDPNTYSNLNKLLAIIDQNLGKDMPVYFHMTWPYDEGSTHPAFINWNNSQKEMFDGIEKALLEVVLKNKRISKIIPNGYSIQNGRKVFPKLTADTFHLSKPLGCYIAGLTLVMTLFPKAKIENLAYIPLGMTKEDLEKIKKIVAETIYYWLFFCRKL